MIHSANPDTIFMVGLVLTRLMSFFFLLFPLVATSTDAVNLNKNCMGATTGIATLNNSYSLWYLDKAGKPHFQHEPFISIQKDLRGNFKYDKQPNKIWYEVYKGDPNRNYSQTVEFSPTKEHPNRVVIKSPNETFEFAIVDGVCHPIRRISYVPQWDDRVEYVSYDRKACDEFLTMVNAPSWSNPEMCPVIHVAGRPMRGVRKKLIKFLKREKMIYLDMSRTRLEPVLPFSNNCKGLYDLPRYQEWFDEMGAIDRVYNICDRNKKAWSKVDSSKIRTKKQKPGDTRSTK